MSEKLARLVVGMRRVLCSSGGIVSESYVRPFDLVLKTTLLGHLRYAEQTERENHHHEKVKRSSLLAPRDRFSHEKKTDREVFHLLGSPIHLLEFRSSLPYSKIPCTLTPKPPTLVSENAEPRALLLLNYYNPDLNRLLAPVVRCCSYFLEVAS